MAVVIRVATLITLSTGSDLALLNYFGMLIVTITEKSLDRDIFLLLILIQWKKNQNKIENEAVTDSYCVRRKTSTDKVREGYSSALRFHYFLMPATSGERSTWRSNQRNSEPLSESNNLFTYFCNSTRSPNFTASSATHEKIVRWKKFIRY